MMNLKDAFRAQNKLEMIMDSAEEILQDSRNTKKTKTTHLRSKVLPDCEDYVVDEAAPSEYADKINIVAGFLLTMLAEREKLCKAIHDAKAGLAVDMDSEVGLNRIRQSLAATLRRMTLQRNNEVTIPGGGTGYRFNEEGNQVTFKCDAKMVTTINFDRNKIRGMATTLGKKADEVSSSLDQCLVNTQVDYELPFDFNDSFDEILQDYIADQDKESA